MGILVQRQKAAELDRAAADAEVIRLVRRRRSGVDVDAQRVVDRVFHLAGDEALPDQVVQAVLVVRKRLLDRVRLAHHAGRADRLVRFLRAFGLRLVDRRALGHVILAEALLDVFARFLVRLRRDRQAVGTHVGDQARPSLPRPTSMPSYNCCATAIVRLAVKPSRREASCWSVLVVNGADGLRTRSPRLISATL